MYFLELIHSMQIHDHEHTYPYKPQEEENRCVIVMNLR
jgi:hypothetical protein